MFERLKEVLNNAKNITVNNVMFQIWIDNDVQELIIELNTLRQLFDRGIDSKGDSLGEYSPFTKQLKQEDNLPFDRITLKQEGVFYASFKVIPLKDGFEIIADPIREDTNLFEDFGKDIVGLTEESINFLIFKTLTLIINETRKQILR